MKPYACEGCATKITDKVSECPSCGLSNPYWGTGWLWIAMILIYVIFAEAAPAISIISLMVGGYVIYKRGSKIRAKRKIYLPTKNKSPKNKEITGKNTSKNLANEANFYKKMASNSVNKEISGSSDTFNSSSGYDNYTFDTLWSGREGIEFRYKDRNGSSSRRILTLTKISSNQHGEIYFGGYCHFREEYRTFKIERISKIEYAGKKFNAEELLNILLD